MSKTTFGRDPSFLSDVPVLPTKKSRSMRACAVRETAHHTKRRAAFDGLHRLLPRDDLRRLEVQSKPAVHGTMRVVRRSVLLVVAGITHHAAFEEDRRMRDHQR